MFDGLAAVRCLLRGLPLLFSSAPRTPLRVLAIMALDTVHLLRTARPMSRKKLGALATMLDFQACTNAVWDGKRLSHADHRTSRRRLERLGLDVHVEEYLRRLRSLESGRPPIGGEPGTFDDARAYREAVARLSLATLAAIALDVTCEEGIRATRCDADLDTLFRMAMLCQVIDDALDYGEDLRAGLPSFLTATSSLSEAVARTAEASRSYGSHSRAVLPLGIALWMLSAVAQRILRARSPLWSRDGTADSPRLQDLPQRGAGPERRDPHDPGRHVRPARPERGGEVHADAHPGHAAGGG